MQAPVELISHDPGKTGQRLNIQRVDLYNETALKLKLGLKKRLQNRVNLAPRRMPIPTLIAKF